MGKYGVLNSPNSGGHREGQIIYNKYEIYVLDVMVDFSKDVVENKKIIVRYTIKLLKIDDFIYTSKDEDVKKLFKSII